MYDRRKMLGIPGSARVAVVAGFDPIRGRWVREVEAASCPSFVGAPHLVDILLRLE